MCYDKRFLKSWAKQKVQQRGQIEREMERVRPASEREVTRRRKEVARELDEIV
jgi:hypothetical protein